MEGVNAPSDAAGQVQGMLKDMTAAQVITKTLDRMNEYAARAGMVADTGYQFRKDVLNGAGIARKLDSIV